MDLGRMVALKKQMLHPPTSITSMLTPPCQEVHNLVEKAKVVKEY